MENLNSQQSQQRIGAVRNNFNPEQRNNDLVSITVDSELMAVSSKQLPMRSVDLAGDAELLVGNSTSPTENSARALEESLGPLFQPITKPKEEDASSNVNLKADTCDITSADASDFPVTATGGSYSVPESASTINDEPSVKVEAQSLSPASQPCSSASTQSSQQAAVTEPLVKTLQNSLTKRQLHDLSLIGTCPRCEMFREQVVLDENNEPLPGTSQLPDFLADNLDIVVIGINPSITSAYVGHHYAGVGNHFWSCVSESGLIQQPVTCHEDYRMVEFGIGFTNVCTRPTKGAAELTRKEMKEGGEILLAKLKRYKPKIAVFNGKGIYEAFVGNKNFYMGKQPEPVPGTDIALFVMPSSSARCAQLPRAADKLPFYVALRKLRDFILGVSAHLNDAEVVFTDYTEMRVTQPDPKSIRKAERRRKRKAEQAQLQSQQVQLQNQQMQVSTQPIQFNGQSAHLSSQSVQVSSLTVQPAQQLKVEPMAPSACDIKMEPPEPSTTSTVPSIATVAGPGGAQYAVLTQQPGHYEWQIYQPTVYYQLTQQPDQQSPYFRPQIIAAPIQESQLPTAEPHQLGFANLLLVDSSQLPASVTSTSGVATAIVSVPSTAPQDRQQLTYTSL